VESQRTYREFYEYEADVYAIDAHHEAAFVHRRTLVDRLLPKAPGESVLDVGCGDGALSAHLAERTGARVYGTDLARKRARNATRRTETARFAQSSVYELPYADDTFSLVLCSDLLEHLDDPERAMRELVRVSARWVLVSVPWSIEIEKTLCPHCLEDYYLYGHQHSFGKAGVERLAAGAGARVEAFEHVIPMFECRRYKWFPPLKWLIWSHFKDTGTLGALIAKVPGARPARAGELVPVARTVGPRSRPSGSSADDSAPALRPERPAPHGAKRRARI
jgi:ubiquinone/menaquinone biosynthesis C-methylase UbiE